MFLEQHALILCLDRQRNVEKQDEHKRARVDLLDISQKTLHDLPVPRWSCFCPLLPHYLLPTGHKDSTCQISSIRSSLCLFPLIYLKESLTSISWPVSKAKGNIPGLGIKWIPRNKQTKKQKQHSASVGLVTFIASD